MCVAANVTGMAHTHAEKAVAITPCREAYLALGNTTDALDAPPLGVYVCDACGHTASMWEATCAACHKVATLQWQEDGDSVRVAAAPKMLIS